MATRLRKNNRWIDVEELGVGSGVDSEAPELSPDKLELARELLGNMTDRQREAVMLRVVDMFTYQQIADELHIGAMNAYRLVQRGFKRAIILSQMREEFEDHADPLPDHKGTYIPVCQTPRKRTPEERSLLMRKALWLQTKGLSQEAIGGALNCSAYLVKELLIEARHKGITVASAQMPE